MYGFYTRDRSSDFGNIVCIWLLRPLGSWCPKDHINKRPLQTMFLESPISWAFESPRTQCPFLQLCRCPPKEMFLSYLEGAPPSAGPWAGPLHPIYDHMVDKSPLQGRSLQPQIPERPQSAPIAPQRKLQGSQGSRKQGAPIAPMIG